MIEERIRKHIETLVTSKHLEMVSYHSIKDVCEEVVSRWSEPHRYWHTLQHLEDFLDWIIECFRLCRTPDEDSVRAIVLAALYHDVVYDPRRNDNEERSVDVLLSHFERNALVDAAIQLIMFTKERIPGRNDLETIMFEADWRVLRQGSVAELIDYERKCFLELQHLPYPVYLQRGAEFLKLALKLCPHNHSNLRFLDYHVNARRPRIGVYAGTFNPFTIGHKSIADKAAKMFDKVIIVKAVNPNKASTDSPVPFSEWLRRVPYEVVSYSGLMVNYLREVSKYANVTYVRGLRNGFDLTYEWNQLQFMKELMPELNHTMIFCDANLQHISSSDVRALMRFDPEKAKRFLV